MSGSKFINQQFKYNCSTFFNFGNKKTNSRQELHHFLIPDIGIAGFISR